MSCASLHGLWSGFQPTRTSTGVDTCVCICQSGFAWVPSCTYGCWLCWCCMHDGECKAAQVFFRVCKRAHMGILTGCCLKNSRAGLESKCYHREGFYNNGDCASYRMGCCLVHGWAATCMLCAAAIQTALLPFVKISSCGVCTFEEVPSVCGRLHVCCLCAIGPHSGVYRLSEWHCVSVLLA